MPIFIDVPDVHRQLVLELLHRARAFLRLKDGNSVRILFTCQLDPTHGQPAHEFPSPILVRAKISRTRAGETKNNPCCEFRIASAAVVETTSRADFDAAHLSILKFFDSQFHANHWYYIDKMHARMIMCDPLGSLAAMEGSSDLFPQPGDTEFDLKFVTDEKSLSEV